MSNGDTITWASSIAFPVTLGGSWIESEAMGTQASAFAGGWQLEVAA